MVNLLAKLFAMLTHNSFRVKQQWLDFSGSCSTPATSCTAITSRSSKTSLRRSGKGPVFAYTVPIAWRTLDEFLKDPAEGRATRSRWLESDVQLIGYMISADQIQDEGSVVNRFLLIPDPGNWLHGPHLDPGEVIHVRLRDGTTVPLLERIPVGVRGRLVVQPAEVGSRHIVYHLVASAVPRR